MVVDLGVLLLVFMGWVPSFWAQAKRGGPQLLFQLLGDANVVVMRRAGQNQVDLASAPCIFAKAAQRNNPAFIGWHLSAGFLRRINPSALVETSLCYFSKSLCGISRWPAQGIDP